MAFRRSLPNSRAFSPRTRTWLPSTRWWATLHRLIDFGDAPVFEAIAYASILEGSRTPPPIDASALCYTWEKGLPLDNIEQVVERCGQPIHQRELKPNGWQLESPATLRLLQKLRVSGVLLGEYVNGQFYRGIGTGLNEAFVVDRATRDQLIIEHKSCSEVLKPIIYPDIYEHQSFAWEDQGFYPANTCYFISTSEKWLTALLNSLVVEWFYGLISNQVRGGYMRAFSDYTTQIPIPPATPAEQALLSALVDRILAAKRAGDEAEVGRLEAEIDEHVFRLYGLTPAEIALVEGADR